MREFHLQKVGHSQVHHEHHGLLGFSDVDPEHPYRQHITQQAWRQDDAVHHGVDVVLVHLQSDVLTGCVVHLQPGAVSWSMVCLTNVRNDCERRSSLSSAGSQVGCCP